MPRREDYARVRDEILAAHALYANGVHALDFHAAPAPIETVYVSSGFHPRVRYEKLWFDSAFAVDTRDGAPFYSHGGSWQGFKSYIARYLGADVTIILFANLADTDTWKIVDGIATIIDPALAAPPEATED